MDITVALTIRRSCPVVLALVLASGAIAETVFDAAGDHVTHPAWFVSFRDEQQRFVISGNVATLRVPDVLLSPFAPSSFFGLTQSPQGTTIDSTDFAQWFPGERTTVVDPPDPSVSGHLDILSMAVDGPGFKDHPARFPSVDFGITTREPISTANDLVFWSLPDLGRNLFLIKETQGFLNAYVFVGANGPPFPWVAGDGLDIVTAWIEEVEVLRAPGPPPGAGPHCPGSPACSELLVPAVELGLSMAGEVGASSGPPPSNEVYVWLFDLDNDLGTGLDPGIDLAVTTGFDDSNPQFGRGRLAVSIYRWNDDTKRWVSQETADTALRQAPVSIDGTDVVLTLRDFALPTSPFRWFAQTSISVGATGTNARNIWTTFIDGTF